jgi:hypothetical protein
VEEVSMSESVSVSVSVDVKVGWKVEGRWKAGQIRFKSDRQREGCPKHSFNNGNDFTTADVGDSGDGDGDSEETLGDVIDLFDVAAGEVEVKWK